MIVSPNEAVTSHPLTPGAVRILRFYNLMIILLPEVSEGRRERGVGWGFSGLKLIFYCLMMCEGEGAVVEEVRKFCLIKLARYNLRKLFPHYFHDFYPSAQEGRGVWFWVRFALFTGRFLHVHIRFTFFRIFWFVDQWLFHRATGWSVLSGYEKRAAQTFGMGMVSITVLHLAISICTSTHNVPRLKKNGASFCQS